MPALAIYKQELAQEKPLAGLTISGSLHLTPETAALARCLQAGGAEIVLSGSNPLSTRDEVCASLVQHDGIVVFAYHGEDRDSYYEHLQATASVHPDIVLDDGADLIVCLAQSGAPAHTIGIEQTTTGVQRLRSMEAAGVLPFSVIALNDAPLKQEFDNPYGTGQNTLDGILRATNILIAGKSVVVAGYGWAGRGIAGRLRGCGAHVIVTEVDPVRALHAHYDGFRIMPMSQALEAGDLFITATGCADVVSEDDFARLKNGAVLANSGHFDVEIDVAALERIAVTKAEIRPNLTEYTLADGRQIFVLAQGRLVGQSAAEASPADIMDLTFTLMAVTVAWAARERNSFSQRKVLLPPAKFTERVAAMKLAALELQHDRLTPAQEQYLATWSSGT
jgi:adenosylhomocysteinase